MVELQESRAAAMHGHGHDDDVDPSTPYDQRLEELEFLRSACAVAQRGQTDKLAAMLARRPDSVHWDGVEGKSGYTPLHYAAREGHVSCVRLLLDKGGCALRALLLLSPHSWPSHCHLRRRRGEPSHHGWRRDGAAPGRVLRPRGRVHSTVGAQPSALAPPLRYCDSLFAIPSPRLDHGADAKLQDGDGETALHKASTQVRRDSMPLCRLHDGFIACHLTRRALLRRATRMLCGCCCPLVRRQHT